MPKENIKVGAITLKYTRDTFLSVSIRSCQSHTNFKATLQIQIFLCSFSPKSAVHCPKPFFLFLINRHMYLNHLSLYTYMHFCCILTFVTSNTHLGSTSFPITLSLGLLRENAVSYPRASPTPRCPQLW